MAGTGYLIGIMLGLILYVLVTWMERDYYKRQHEVIRRKIEKLDKSREKERAAESNKVRSKTLHEQSR
jgi:hypothetical protein